MLMLHENQHFNMSETPQLCLRCNKGYFSILHATFIKIPLGILLDFVIVTFSFGSVPLTPSFQFFFWICFRNLTKQSLKWIHFDWYIFWYLYDVVIVRSSCLLSKHGLNLDCYSLYCSLTAAYICNAHILHLLMFNFTENSKGQESKFGDPWACR